MRLDTIRLTEIDRWIAWVRLGAIVFVLLEVGVFSTKSPAGYDPAEWATAGVFCAGAVALWALSRRRGGLLVAVAAIVFDTVVIAAFATIYSYEYGSPTRWALMFVVVEAALAFGLVGGVALPALLFPYLIFVEWWRADRFAGPGFLWDRVTFPVGIFLITGLIVGWLVERLAQETAIVAARAAEAEDLRDQLGRRVDVLEAASRCARALASSLDVDDAFSAFIRELSALIPFDRVSIVLAEGDRAEVIAVAGRGAEATFPPGSARPVGGSVLDEVLEGRLVYRDTIQPPKYPEEEELVRLGLGSRVLAPLQVGPRTIGALALMREAPRGFTPEDVELAAFLGRLVAGAVQNIRSYEAERRTVEELRRLSALRADFVSLVSHELRSPMSAVIGAARTLQGRWRELSAAQRDAFLALIGDETARLADLVADVLDTSRIEAGTFSYSFSDVDVAAIVDDVVAKVAAAQDEVRVRADVGRVLPHVRGDRERLRQVVQNLVDNAVKYSPADAEVRVEAYTQNGCVRVDVRDEGPGIAGDDQRLIFEKFGRAASGDAKPGTGLGLFIARSIAEAHGGTLTVESAPGRGSTFRIELPLDVDRSGSDA